MADRPSRRQFLITVGSVAAATLAACKSDAGGGASGSGGAGSSSLTCTDVSMLGASDLQTRTTLGYEDRSADPARGCVKCIQWIPASAPGACGGCRVMKGPIHPDGTCKAFAGRPS